MGDNVTQEEIDKIIAVADRHGDHKINYEDFVKEIFQMIQTFVAAVGIVRLAQTTDEKECRRL